MEISGIGLHSGRKTSLCFRPAPVNTGIYFVRTDIAGRPAIGVSAEHVRATTMATTLGCQEFSISTVEHCLSALTAFRVDNLFIELSGPEIPIGDGSAQVFLKALLEANVVEQDQPRKYLYITQPIYCGDDEKHAYVVPYNGLRVTCTIDFPHRLIGRQKIDIEISEHSFSREISKARTFGFLKDAEKMREKGLALGASFDNAVVLDHNEVLNPEGVRFPDEFVRHKVLDALGDLVTLGKPLMGHLILFRAGHDLMNRLVKKILASPESFREIELGADLRENLGDVHFLWAFS